MTETTTIERLRAYRKTYIAMLVSSFLSLVASLVLAIDAVKLAAQPTGQLSCDINAVLSCGTVAKAWQSQLLGFPNSFLGLMTEPVVITVAVAGLGLVTFPRWFMRAAHIVYGAGLIFALWLLSQPLFVINSLCPWCLLVTGSTITVFSTITRVVLLENSWNFTPERQEKIVSFLERGWGRVFYVGSYATITIVIFAKYGSQLFN